MAINWLQESVPMVRILINDFACEPEFDDSRISEVLTVAAKLVAQDPMLSFDNEYVATMRTLTVSPDPLEENDQDFITLAVLKAACILDQGLFRAKALMEGVSISCGPSSLSVGGHLKGFETLLTMGPCKAFEEAKQAYIVRNTDLVRAILSPFTSNKFDAASLQYRHHPRNGFRYN